MQEPLRRSSQILCNKDKKNEHKGFQITLSDKYDEHICFRRTEGARILNGSERERLVSYISRSFYIRKLNLRYDIKSTVRNRRCKIYFQMSLKILDKYARGCFCIVAMFLPVYPFTK